MREEYRTIKKGIVAGAELFIRHPMINPQESNDILVFDGKSITIDSQNLPWSLARLIPSGYLTPNRTAEHWTAFILEAIRLGRLTPAA